MAGGIISNDVIKSTPTIWTDTETARAIKNINSNSKYCTIKFAIL